MLVPTERHVERLEISNTVSLRRFLGAHASKTARPASPASRRLGLLSAADHVLTGDSRVRAPDDPAARVALAAAVDITIGNLLQSGCNAAHLRATKTPRGLATALLWERQAELVEKAGFYDDRALLDVATIEALEGSIALRGAADISPQLLSFVLRAHRVSREKGGSGAQISLPRISIHPDPMAEVAALIEQRFAEEPDAPEIAWEDPPSEGTVEVVDAASPEAEARAAALAITRALDEGKAIDRIAIAVPPSSEALLEAVRSALRDASIPFSEAQGPRASAAPEVRALVGLVEMASSRVERDTIIEILRTPGLHAGSWVEARSEADAARYAATLADRLRELPLSADRDGALFLRAASLLEKNADEAWMGAALQRLVDVVLSIRKVGSRSAFARLLGDVAHRLRLGEPSASEIQAALRDDANVSARLALEAIGEGSVALRQALEVLRDSARAAPLFDMDQARGGLEELSAELRLDLDGLSTAPRGGSARAASVRIASPRELAGIEHDLVIVMGLRARAFGGEGSADPWLDERTIAAIPQSVRPRSTGARRAARSAEIAWAMALAQRTVLTRSATDEEGREAEPAHEIITAWVARGAAHREEPASRLSAGASTPSARSAELVLLANGEPPAVELWARVGVENDRRAFFLDPRRAPGAFTGRVPERSLSLLEERVGGRSAAHSVGVSVIEGAAGCAFRAFAERVLGARRAEDAVETASPRDRGNDLHLALYVAFDRRRELGPSASPADILADAERAIHAALRFDFPMSPLLREARSLVVRDALRVLAEEIDHPSHLVYAVGERRFGRGEPDPYGALPLVSSSGGEVFVNGQIDRIDRSTDGSQLQIIDYKTGQPPSKKAVGETVFQLPLYAAAARRFFGDAEVSGVYLRVKAGGAVERSPRKPSDARFDDAELSRIERNAADVVERFWSGDVAPRPSHPRQCGRCDARDICRRPAVIPKSEGDDTEIPKTGAPATHPETEGSES